MTEERKPRTTLASDPDCCCDEREELQHIRAEDGRRGEKRVKETCDEKVTQIYFEPEIKKDLVKEIVEQKCPAVCHRETKTYKADGSVEVIVEDIQNELKVVDRRVEVPVPAPAPTPPTTGFATKDDVDELKGAIEAIGDRLTPRRMVKAQDLLEDNVKNVDKETLMNGIFLVAFMVEACILGYVVFFI